MASSLLSIQVSTASFLQLLLPPQAASAKAEVLCQWMAKELQECPVDRPEEAWMLHSAKDLPRSTWLCLLPLAKSLTRQRRCSGVIVLVGLEIARLRTRARG